MNTPESAVPPPIRDSLARDAILAATSLSVVFVVEELAIMFCVWAVPEASMIWLDRLMLLRVVRRIAALEKGYARVVVALLVEVVDILRDRLG